MKPQVICLSMIGKDEVAVIRRCSAGHGERGIHQRGFAV